MASLLSSWICQDAPSAHVGQCFACCPQGSYRPETKARLVETWLPRHPMPRQGESIENASNETVRAFAAQASNADLNPLGEHVAMFASYSCMGVVDLSNPNSHTGSLIMATQEDIGNNTKCPVNPLSWGCKKIPRVATSTLAAETSLNSVLDQLSWVRLCWAWIQDRRTPWKDPKLSFEKLPGT